MSGLSRWLFISLVATTLSIVIIAMRGFGLLDSLELGLYDRARALGSTTVAPPSVVVVEIRESDIQRYESWPMNDRLLGRAIDLLEQSPASAIGLDLYRNLPVPPGENVLASSFARSTRTIGVWLFGDGKESAVPGPPALVQKGQVGFNDILLDRGIDDRVRRGLLFLDDGSAEVATAFNLQLALTALAAEGIAAEPDPNEPTWLRLGPTTMEPLRKNFGGYGAVDDRGYQFLIDYAQSDIPTYSFDDLLEGRIDADVLRGKIVLIGANAASLPDVFATPLGTEMRGVTLHAHLVDQLMRFARGQSRPLSALPEPAVMLLIVLATALGAIFSASTSAALPTGWRIALGVGSAVAIPLCGALALSRGLWLPVAAPSLGWASAASITALWIASSERSARDQVMSLFSRHVSAEVAEDIWRHRAEFMHGGRPRAQNLEATVLFVDMVDSTRLSEGLAPAQVMEWTNTLMDALAVEVRNARGIVDDYFGDGLKATFGIPIPRTRPEEIAADAQHAAECALSMSSALGALNRGFAEKGLPRAALRIGLASGTVNAGSLGSSDRLKYAAAGSVVVTSQRLEATSDVAHDFEHEPCRILLTRSTLELIGDRFPSKPVGSLELKGLAEAVEAHKLVTGPEL